MFELWDRTLDLEPVLAAVRHDGAGAVDVFFGVVRDHSAGRTVTRLEYEAYATMAVAEMQRIGAELRERWPTVRVAALHRVGSLAVGEVAVLCAASAPHRAEAFSACRALIDELKARVPIWKREWGPDGAAWVGWEDARCTSEGHHHDHQTHGGPHR